MTRRTYSQDRMQLTPRGQLFVAFLDAGYSADDADALAEQALKQNTRLLEDVRLGTPRPMKLNTPKS